jgi:type II secretory pathway component PulF
MAESAMSGGKAAWNAIKAHWGWFLLIFAAIIIAALWYDHKNTGDLTKKVAGLPLVGKLFACVALLLGASKLLALRLLLGSA